MKWAYLGEEASRGSWGAPVYEHHKSLSGPIYFPDETVKEALTAHCREQGEAFFARKDWKAELWCMADAMLQESAAGRYETQDEYLERARKELQESKRILEMQLDKRVEVLCWPGGGYSDAVKGIATSLFKAMTVSSDRRHEGGFDEDDNFWIARMGAQTIALRNGQYIYPGGLYTYFAIREYCGSTVARLLRRCGKAMYLLCSMLVRKCFIMKCVVTSSLGSCSPWEGGAISDYDEVGIESKVDWGWVL